MHGNGMSIVMRLQARLQGMTDCYYVSGQGHYEREHVMVSLSFESQMEYCMVPGSVMQIKS